VVQILLGQTWEVCGLLLLSLLLVYCPLTGQVQMAKVKVKVMKRMFGEECRACRSW
jgi:hypothetical protein